METREVHRLTEIVTNDGGVGRAPEIGGVAAPVRVPDQDPSECLLKCIFFFTL